MVSAAALLAALPAAAQTTAEDVRRELQEMRRAYDAELQRMRRDYEGRIQQLETRVRAAESLTAGAPQAQQPPLQPGRAPPPELATQQPPDPKSASVTRGVLSTPGREPVQSVRTAPPRGTVNANSFNPAIGLVLDGRFAAFESIPANYTMPGFQFPAGAGLGNAGFGIGESELSFSANVDDKLFGTLIVAIDNTGAVSVEEAYFETLALPFGFTAKGGRFFSGFGYLNAHHRHSWDFADAPLPYRAFLSNQYRDDGVQLRWLAPTPFLLEVGGEIYRGANYPFNGGHTFAGSGSMFLRVGDDIDETKSFRLGVSHLRGRAVQRTTDGGVTNFQGVSMTTGIDGVFKWAPTGKPAEEQLKLQAELLFREEIGGVNGKQFYSRAWGWYASAVWRFLPNWEAGVRADQVYVGNSGNAVSDGLTLQGWGQNLTRQTAALTYYTSEFGRFRLQFNRDWSTGMLDHQVLLQYTLSLGAHGAHKY
jgi:hypothetical protein